MHQNLLKVGVFKGPHGLHGWVKARVQLDDPTLLQHNGTLHTDDNQAFQLLAWQPAGQGLLALQLQGITTVHAAQTLRGGLWVNPQLWPKAKGEVWVRELVSATVFNPSGHPIGTVTQVVNLPAGPAVNVQLTANPHGAPPTALVPLAQGCLITSSQALTLTELGQAFVQSVLDTPPPKAQTRRITQPKSTS